MITSNIKLRYNQNDPLNGAFSYLQKTFNKENICDGIVKVSASSSVQNLYNPVIKRDFNTDDYWFSRAENGSWYEVDFLQNNFFLTSYLIRAHAVDFFENWKMLGSNDGVNFDVLDEVTNFLKPSTAFHNLSFKCKYPKMRRIFRLVPNGKRYKDDFISVIYRLEFYGRFVVFDPKLMKTCRIIYSMNHYALCFISFYLSC